MIELEACVTTLSWVNREYRRGLGTHPVLRISEVEVLFPNTWWQPVRKSRTQLHGAGSRLRAPSLMMSLEGIMVLKAEL
jgi:hypothetical protein